MRSIRSASTSEACRPAGPLPPSWGRRTPTCTRPSAFILASSAAPPATSPLRSPPCGRVADPKQLQRPDLPCRPSFSMAIATPRCTRTTATEFLSNPPKRRVQRRSFADGCPAGMPIPAPSLPTAAGGRSPNTGTFMAAATRGRAAVPPAPTPIHEGRTGRGKCCVSSSSIRSWISRASQRAQIVRDVDELADDGGVPEVTGRGISGPGERDRADAAGLLGQRLRLHYGRVRVEALDRLAGGDTVVG